MILDVSSYSWGSVPCPNPVRPVQIPTTLGLCGGLGPLDMVYLGLVIGGRIGFLVLHQARLFLVDGNLLLSGLVVASAWVETAAALREEGLPAGELSEETDEDSSDQHADDSNGDASNDAHQDREDDVRGHLAEEQRPTIRTVEHSIVLVVLGGRLGMAVVVVSLAAHHTSAAVRLHLVDLVGDDGLQLAQGGGALGSVAL